MNDLELSCADFTEKLASKSPTPGGGGAAALAGALAAALCSMVGNYTIGKKKYADVEEEVIRLNREAERCRIELLELVRKDAEAFEPLSKAYAYPKNAPDREEVLEKATAAACQPPLQMVRACAKVCDLLEEMGEIGSKMLVSDVGCGALLCRAAMESAALNVFINTGSMKDRSAAGAMEEEVQALLERYSVKAAAIAEKVKEAVKK